jgi:hypothetical protein
MPEHEYGIVRLTRENYLAALKKSDFLEVMDVPDEVQEAALKIFDVKFTHMKQRFHKTQFENVHLVPEKAAGYPYRKSKRKAVKEHYSFLTWYCREGNTARPNTIWSATGKIEYLPMLDIENNKIRIFRNPSVDYLILEKMYFQEMDEYLLSEENLSWSALGFKKEYGHWNEFVEILRTRNRDNPLLKRWYVRWDVQHFDKKIGPRKMRPIEEIRRTWFEKPPTLDQLKDLEFLFEEACWSLELLPNGEIVCTAMSQKSGRFRTATDNTLFHIYMIIVHYVKVCLRKGLNPSFTHMMRVLICFVYSDDIQLSTDYPEFVEESDLRDTFAWFDMGLKDYKMSDSPFDIHFLGAANGTWADYWVPVYDENRMLYAIAFTEGRLNEEDRTQRISGLAHNLAFSERGAAFVVDLCNWLHDQGLWVGTPLLDRGELRVAYTPAGSALEHGPKNRVFATPKPESLCALSQFN